MKIVRSITIAIDWFYFKPIRAVMPLQTFRYAACGGCNMLLNWVLYFVLYNFILDKEIVTLGFVAISPHIAAFLIVFPITFITGFLLNRYIAFTDSPLRGRTQLIRYLLSVAGSVVLNYLLLKVFVDACHLYPTPSQILSTGLITVYSYLAQKHFSFRGSRIS